MAVKKSELYASIWASCDALRGGMDASLYKDYVLVLLFIKYTSDKYAGKPFSPITVPAGASFADMVLLKGKPDIGDQIMKKIIGPLQQANKLAKMPNFNDPMLLGDGKEMVERLTNLISIFENPNLDFTSHRAADDDLLGDAYEYLMRNFATESGKSKGQFYTPAEVSRIMAKVIGIGTADTSSKTTAYDPACGSGSLLLKVADEAGTEITLYGQEKDVPTSGLAYMNMVLHDNAGAEIRQGNTLTTPHFTENGKLKQFDYVVANPPFSDKRWSTGLDPMNDPYERFKTFGVPPSKQGDYAYLLHIIRSTKNSGQAACILPHGVLFRGNAEAAIRRKLIEHGYIKAIIGLPANLFYGTGIPACILVIDKKGAANREGIFMIDASNGFYKDGPKNRLRARDIHRIVDAFRNGSKVDGYATFVENEKIAQNDFNLNLPRYIDSRPPEDIQDLEGHLRGGIPERDVDDLKSYWAECPDLKASLFAEERPGYLKLIPDRSELREAINTHPQFQTFTMQLEQHFDAWRTRESVRLKNLHTECKPKEVIFNTSESLLAHYEGQPLIDPYAIYQHLMDYWSETMQDDLYQISEEGWTAKPVRPDDKKAMKWTCDLVPKALMVARFYAAEQREIDTLQSKLDITEAELTELADDHGGEGAILEGVSSKKDAQEASLQLTLDTHAEVDPKAVHDLSLLQDQIVDVLDDIRYLSGEFIFDPLKNKRGALTKKAVQNRLSELLETEETKSTELELMQKYLRRLDDAKTAKDGVKKLQEVIQASVARRRAKQPDTVEFADFKTLERYLELLLGQARQKAELKEAENVLDAAVFARYVVLSDDEVKTLVVDDKWMGKLSRVAGNEVGRVARSLTERVQTLGDRYAETLIQLNDAAESAESKVLAHLKTMGLAW